MRWWPPIAVAAMLLLGWAVGDGSTPIDDEFARHVRNVAGGQPRWLLVFTEWRLLGPVLLGCVAAAAYRRIPGLAVAAVACPLSTVAITQALKRCFGRHNGVYLEYPSGHTALMVSVLGMAVVVAGARWWSLIAAAAASLLGALGLVACGYHFVTDTIGAALLASAAVGIAARLAGVCADGSSATGENR